jgi:hypothetical protein
MGTPMHFGESLFLKLSSKFRVFICSLNYNFLNLVRSNALVYVPYLECWLAGLFGSGQFLCDMAGGRVMGQLYQHLATFRSTDWDRTTSPNIH